MKTQREREGWLGSVKRVTIEVAEFSEREGVPVLGPRVPLLTISYDEQGKRVIKDSYYTEHSDSKENDYVTEYDAEGNVREQSYYQHGTFQYKVVPSYENEKVVKEVFYDLLGNPRYVREHKYDDRNNPIEMVYSEVNGKIISKLRYENEYDVVGNLIKVTIFQWVTNNGESFYKPSTAHFQAITYYKQ